MRWKLLGVLGSIISVVTQGSNSTTYSEWPSAMNTFNSSPSYQGRCRSIHSRTNHEPFLRSVYWNGLS